MELFKAPTAEYRAAPFWAWNTRLDPAVLEEQIGYFKEMGFGGIHAHPRTGLDTVYLSPEYMDCIRTCYEKTRNEDMLLYLYDEDRWPSGGAGGYVTKNEAYRLKHLLFTRVPYTEDDKPTGERASYATPTRTCNGSLMAAYDVTLDKNDYMTGYRRIGENDEAEGYKWYAYMESDRPNTWHNLQTYVDTMNKEAIEKFIEITHEKYKQTVGEGFGKTIPSIFSDEPTYTYVTCLTRPSEAKNAVFPWTQKLAETFKEKNGYDILDVLPELFFQPAGGVLPQTRVTFWDHVSELFASSFADTIGAWCEKNNLLFTGHLMWEPTLHTQVIGVGEAMRSYRSFGLPGIDMLGNGYEYMTAKQAQSASHQFGRVGVLSEMYGVTSWSFDFRGHKLQGDWQAALGITTRVHHLSLLSLLGEAKRDYPASFNVHVPWYKEYPYVEDHYARLNTVLTRGKARVRVGVIHPIESMWLNWGPTGLSQEAQDRLDAQFKNVTEWLLFGNVDFDFICESLLPRLCEKGDNPLPVGSMAYEAVIIPGSDTIRSSTLERLEAFCLSGGTLIFMGDVPAYVDGAPSNRAKALAEAQGKMIPFERLDLMKAVEPFRDVEIRQEVNGMMLMMGGADPHHLYQLREDGDCKWLFIAHGKPTQEQDVCSAEDIRLLLTGLYQVELYDTIHATIKQMPTTFKNGRTLVLLTMHRHDSFLFRLTPAAEPYSDPDAVKTEKTEPQAPFMFSLPQPPGAASNPPNRVKVTLHDPNVLMLDRAEYALDNEEYAPAEEILRIDNIFRKRLGFPARHESLVQPWVLPKKPAVNRARLRFTFHSEIELEQVKFALEELDKATIVFNGRQLTASSTGHYIDRAITTMEIGPIQKGENVIEVTMPFANHSNLEWSYILGDFGVRAEGAKGIITAPVRELSFGDIVPQGLPFYGGNITYHVPLDATVKGEIVHIHAPRYRGALIAVEADGKRRGVIAYSPYNLDIPRPQSGQVDFVLFGTRVNTLGAVHMVTDRYRMLHPRAYRTQGDMWSDEYVLEPVGILKSPRITIE